MEIKTKYITPDDYLDYFGEDLMSILPDGDNPSNKAYAFLMRIENRMATFLNAEFYRNVDNEYPEFTDYQKEHYKYALLEQALYVVRNGDISADSGYTFEEGERASNDTILKKIISQNARQELLLCGLWCRKVRGNRSRWWGIWR